MTTRAQRIVSTFTVAQQHSNKVDSGLFVEAVPRSERIHVGFIVYGQEVRTAGSLARVRPGGHQLVAVADFQDIAEIVAVTSPLVDRGIDTAVAIELLDYRREAPALAALSSAVTPPVSLVRLVALWRS